MAQSVFFLAISKMEVMGTNTLCDGQAILRGLRLSLPWFLKSSQNLVGQVKGGGWGSPSYALETGLAQKSLF